MLSSTGMIFLTEISIRVNLPDFYIDPESTSPFPFLRHIQSTEGANFDVFAALSFPYFLANTTLLNHSSTLSASSAYN